MIHLIDELKVIPGVIGACIYNSHEGLKVSNLPAIFKPDRLNVIGKQLSKLYSAGTMSFDDLANLVLHYDESVIVARELEKNTLVFAVCDPSFNHNLLTMSLNLLQEEYKIGKFETSPPAAGGAASENVKGQPAQAAGHERSAQLKGLLAEMKTVLAKVLGPMAGFVFDEALDSWTGLGAADMRRIDELIALIETEIGDQGKAADFREEIAPLLKSY